MPGLASARGGDPRFDLAWGLLDEVDALSTPAFRTHAHEVELKTDGSPVTDTDLAVEALMSRRLHSSYPDDLVVCEESPQEVDRPDLWIIDPLDGTSNFVEGVPIFAHLVAWVQRGKPLFALVSAPGMSCRWWAYRGLGAFRWEQPIHVSDTSRVAQARICYGGLADYGDTATGFTTLVRSCTRSRGFGNFLPHMLVAEGTYDLASSGGGGELWDIAPLALVVTEAGGMVTAFDGSTWDARQPVLTSNAALHNEAMSIIARN